MNKIVASIVFLAVGLRLAAWYGVITNDTAYIEPDSLDYLRLAEEIVTRHRYGSADEPELFRAPGYPFFLAVSRMVTRSIWLPLLIQALLDAGSCYFVYRIARLLFSPTVAVVSLFFQSLSIVSIVYAVLPLSESIYTFLLVAFIYCLIRIQRRSGEQVWLPVAAGMLLSLMVYFRAVTIPYVVLPLLCLALGRQINEAGIVFFVVILCCGFWYQRNIAVSGFPHFSSVGFVNLYRYNACLLLAKQNDRAFLKQQAIIDGEFAKIGSQKGIAAYARKQGSRAIRTDPIRYVVLHIRSCANNLLPAGTYLAQIFGKEIGGKGTIGVLNTEGLIAGVRHYFHGQWGIFIMLMPTIALLAIQYLAAMISIIPVYHERSYTNVLIHLTLALTIVYFLLVPGGASHPRFRVPAAPFLSLYAGAGVACVVQFLRRLKTGVDKTS